MDVTLKKVTRRFPDHKLLKQLYKKAFPIEERAPFWLLSAKAKKENVDFWAIYDSHKFVGLIYIVNYADLSYIFYFAVLDFERGKGYGSKVLETVKQKYQNRRIFLAIEQLDEDSENYDIRVKRKRFYRQNGFVALDLKLKEASVVYELMGIGGTVTAQEYDLLIGAYAGRLLKRLVTMKIIE